MKVIFTKTGEIKEVRTGYAVNYLIPNKLVLPATNLNVEQTRAGFEKIKNKRAGDLEKLKEWKHILAKEPLIVHAPALDSGKLFGGFGPKEIAQLIAKKKKISVSPSSIKLEKRLKSLGSFDIPVQLGHGVNAQLKVHVEKLQEDES